MNSHMNDEEPAMPRYWGSAFQAEKHTSTKDQESSKTGHIKKRTHY